MRRSLVSLALALVGCSVLTIEPDAREPFVHGEYTLRCNDMPADECIRQADEIAARLGGGASIKTLSISAGGSFELCRRNDTCVAADF